MADSLFPFGFWPEHDDSFPEEDSSASGVFFDIADIAFELSDPDRIIAWIQTIILAQEKELGEIQYVFCSDAFLLDLNQQYLQHTTFTDIITFDYTKENRVCGDLYISVERVRENAKKFSVPMAHELHRVMIHGVFHLCGFKDKTPAESAKMRDLENEALSQL